MASHHLQAGVEIITISHLLGHASVETANRYAVVILRLKVPKWAEAIGVSRDVAGRTRGTATGPAVGQIAGVFATKSAEIER